MKRKLLLISNSTHPGEQFLSWPKKSLIEFIKEYNIKNILFIPYAGVNLSPKNVRTSYDLYFERVYNVFKELNVYTQTIHTSRDKISTVKKAQAIVVGGGNTFHLVKVLHDLKLMKTIQEVVRKGIPYIGWSAGANIACPTMKTTNDMPICEPFSFDCLNLIPFQINPHYIDSQPVFFGGETREQRIMEFLTINRNAVVVGLREGCLFSIKNNLIELQGKASMRLFRFGKDPKEYFPGADIGFLLLD